MTDRSSPSGSAAKIRFWIILALATFAVVVFCFYGLRDPRRSALNQCMRHDYPAGAIIWQRDGAGPGKNMVDLPACFATLLPDQTHFGPVVFLHAVNTWTLCAVYLKQLEEDPDGPLLLVSTYDISDLKSIKNVSGNFKILDLGGGRTRVAHAAVHAGLSDPQDPAHFTVTIDLDQKSFIVDGRVDENGKVVLANH